MNKQRLLAASYGHLSIDILNSSVAMILTLVAIQYDLTIAQIGLLAHFAGCCASINWRRISARRSA